MLETLAIGTGLILGLKFHVIAAGIAAALAAGIWVGFGDKVATRVVALLIVFFAWLIGDGWGVFQSAEHLSSIPSTWYEWLGTVVWGVVSLAFGYALPTWVGVFVGSRVKKGTGWLAASFIGAITPIVLGMLTGALNARL